MAKWYFKNDIVSCPGSEIEDVLTPVVKEDGSIALEKSGVRNVQEEIDSYEESCDLNSIIARYMSGDTEALSRNIMNFGDFTKFPKTYAEMLQLQIDSNNLFNSLPDEVRQKFDNDCNKFFAQSGTEEWFNILNPIKEAVVENNDDMKGEVKE